jgi:hypothetical protein
VVSKGTSDYPNAAAVSGGGILIRENKKAPGFVA